MNMKTKIFQGMKYLLLIAVSFIAIVLVINLSIFDEELMPEVEAMFIKQQQSIEADNAYIAIWGLTADSDKNFIEAGIKLIERHNQITRNDENAVLTDLDLEQTLGKRDLDREWLEQYKNCRARTRSGCLKEMSSVINDNPIQNPRLLRMLDRYSSLLKMSKYHLLMELHAASLLPSYSEIMRLGQIRIANIFLTKDTMSTLESIEEDLVFWRLMLDQSGDLLNKMVAVAALWRNYSYLSEIIKTENLSQYEAQKIKSISKNITSEKFDMTKIFYAETKWVLVALNNAMSGNNKDNMDISSELSLPLWQKNATLNHVYRRNHLPLICLSKLPSKDFYKFRTNGTLYCGFPSEGEIKNYQYSLYNPVGKILVSVALPAYPDYIARVHDLNGVISLVKLQLEVKDIENENIAETIKKSSVRNLYTGEPMNYDKEKNEIGFDCLDKGSVCKLSL